MEYINCFQITSLVLVTMIAIHYFSHKRLNNAENRNFVCFLAFSGVYVLLDMLSAVDRGRRQQRRLQNVSAGPDALLFL